MHTRRPLPPVFAVVLIAALLLAACQPAAQKATETPTQAPSATASPTPAPTATATATPAPTATPQPTPLPAGYHALDWAGFSFVSPENWEIVNSDSTFIVLRDPKDGSFFMVVFAEAADETITTELLLDAVVQIFEGELTEYEASDPVEVNLKGADSAQMIEIIRGSGLKQVTYRVYEIHSAQRVIVMVFGGSQATLDAKKLTLSRVFNSAAVTMPQPYGLDRAETLYQLASEPEPVNLDPATSVSSAADFTGLLFSGLVRLTPDMQIQPDLAESWQVSGEGAVYTFTLREGLMFADETRLTAQDVVDSWERATDPELDSTTARTYLGDIQGVQDKLDGKADAISGLKVVDERTLQVTLLGPRPYFLAKLTYPTAMVIDKRQVSSEDEDWVWQANASGPFMIKEHIEGEALIFERNPNYYQPAGVRYLLFSFVWGGSPKSLFEDGELDLLPVGVDDVLQISKEDDPLHDRLVSTPNMCTTMLQINLTLAPTDDLKLREALALAIDRDELNEVMSSGLAMPAGAILPPGMPGYSADLDAYRFDPDAAKQALEESTLAGKSVTLKVSVSGYAGSENALVSALTEMWKTHLGINVQVVNLDPVDFTRASRENPANVVVYGWCADYPDPENFLDLLYHTGSDFNVAAYSNAEIDALLEQARIEPDPQQRLALYHQVEETLLSSYASLPLFYSISHELVSQRVGNYQPAPVGVAQMQNVTLGK